MIIHVQNQNFGPEKGEGKTLRIKKPRSVIEGFVERHSSRWKGYFPISQCFRALWFRNQNICFETDQNRVVHRNAAFELYLET
jgi:hypothetical protein